IAAALNALLGADAVSVEAVDVGAIDYKITFKEPDSVALTAQSGVGTGSGVINGSVLVSEVTAGNAGRTELSVQDRFDKFTFTNVDANTIIKGGGNTNTFTINGNANFPGTIIGGTGLRPLSAHLNVETLIEALELNPPDFS